MDECGFCSFQNWEIVREDENTMYSGQAVQSPPSGHPDVQVRLAEELDTRLTMYGNPATSQPVTSSVRCFRFCHGFHVMSRFDSCASCKLLSSMACDGDLLRLPSVVLHLPFLPRNTVEQNVDSPSAHWSQGPSLTASSQTHQKHCNQALTCSFQQEGTRCRCEDVREDSGVSFLR